MPNEVDEIIDEPVDDTEPLQPLEVKIINKNEKKWNDSNDEPEYDEHIITDEEIKEHGNT